MPGRRPLRGHENCIKGSNMTFAELEPGTRFSSRTDTHYACVYEPRGPARARTPLPLLPALGNHPVVRDGRKQGRWRQEMWESKGDEVKTRLTAQQSRRTQRLPPNELNPSMPPPYTATPSEHFSTHYMSIYGNGRHSPTRQNFNLDKVTRRYSYYPEREDIMRDFMTGAAPAAAAKMAHAGKDTQESKGWDGSMAFDAVYSQKYVTKDTSSSIVLG
mmetsp:Transcript_5702/g.19471  ORF Transcript_5702/g.19471 Transcript_5702/m.19471 type:complete len:217 (+) Transcript_5702:15-665(+)